MHDVNDTSYYGIGMESVFMFQRCEAADQQNKEGGRGFGHTVRDTILAGKKGSYVGD